MLCKISSDDLSHSENLCLVKQIKRQEEIQRAINSLLKLSLLDMSLEVLLTKALIIVLSIPWLSVETKGAIFLVEEENNSLIMKSQQGLSAQIQLACGRVPFGKCLCGRAAMERQMQFANYLDDRHDTTYPGIQPHGHYCMPILYGEDVLGVLNLYVSEGHQRQEQEEDFLKAIADTLAGLIARKKAEQALHQSLEELNQTVDGVINALSTMAEIRDPYTAGHQQRVAEIATAIAITMQLPAPTVKAVQVAALLHDIGKINVPAELLAKPGRLSNMEFALIKCHPKMGYEILKQIPFDWPIADIVLQHHERLNGSGYPQGISDQQIRLEARIIAVADVVEAMSAHRPYRAALGWEMAAQYIIDKQGIFYDRKVVEACLQARNSIDPIESSYRSSSL